MDLKREVKNVVLSSLKESFDIKVGIEIENIIYNDKNERIMVNPHNSISATELLQLLKNGKSVSENYSLEPGGQLEWASTPYKDLNDLEDSIIANRKLLNEVLETKKLKVMPFGLDPNFSPMDIELIDQKRYSFMDEKMAKSGSMGQWMMRCTSSVQVNFDASSKNDMEEIVFVADCLHPIASYLFSNSPFKNKKPAYEKNLRNIIWANTDNFRCNNLFDQGIYLKTDLIDKYINFFLSVPAIFSLDRKGIAIQTKSTIGELLLEKNDNGSLNKNHILSFLRQIFTNVRIKNLVEIRGADRPPEGFEIAPAAFWTGLLMDKSVRENILATVSSWERKDRVLLNDASFALNTSQMGPSNKTYGYWISYFGELALNGLKKR
ncbi:MAG: glutamate-cysteine ligase family protein, partial [Candidatus Neomarinimicrobiota bacterium]